MNKGSYSYRIELLSRAVSRVIEQYPIGVVLFVSLVTSFPLILELDAPIHGDTWLYYRVARSVVNGVVPYRDQELEYPPYAVPLFIVPQLFTNQLQAYKLIFTFFSLAADLLLKGLLIMVGSNHRAKLTQLSPFILYSVAISFTHHFLLQRYDVFPAVICTCALCFFSCDRFKSAGALLAIGAGMKLYPVLFFPALWFLARRRNGGAKFAIGILVGLLPVLLLTFYAPWWNFLLFHNSRGLQVESMYASILWLLRLIGMVEIEWASATAWMEVRGASAQQLLPWAKMLMATTTLGSVGFSIWVSRRASSLGYFQIPRLLLIPLLAFVGFNIVLSPQYMIWLLPLAALGVRGGVKWPMVMISLATAMTPIFFPSHEYGTGLNLGQTLALLVRNFSLLVVWVALIVEFWKGAKNKLTEAGEEMN